MGGTIKRSTLVTPTWLFLACFSTAASTYTPGGRFFWCKGVFLQSIYFLLYFIVPFFSLLWLLFCLQRLPVHNRAVFRLNYISLSCAKKWRHVVTVAHVLAVTDTDSLWAFCRMFDSCKPAMRWKRICFLQIIDRSFYEKDLLYLFSSLTRQVRKIKKWHLHPKYNMKDSTRDQTCKCSMIFHSRSKISLYFQGVMWLWQFWRVASSIKSSTVFLLRKKL